VCVFRPRVATRPRVYLGADTQVGPYVTTQLKVERALCGASSAHKYQGAIPPSPLIWDTRRHC